MSAAANGATAAAPSLAALLGARIAAGACGGAFIAAAAATAAGSSAAPRPEPRSGSRLAPFAGGAIGRHPVLFGITTVAALAAPAAAAFSPHEGSRPVPAPATIARGAALLTLATTPLRATGSFTSFTYIGVVLHRNASVGASGPAGFQFVFGLTGLADAAAAGWLTRQARFRRSPEGSRSPPSHSPGPA